MQWKTIRSPVDWNHQAVWIWQFPQQNQSHWGLVKLNKNCWMCCPEGECCEGDRYFAEKCHWSKTLYIWYHIMRYIPMDLNMFGVVCLLIFVSQCMWPSSFLVYMYVIVCMYIYIYYNIYLNLKGRTQMNFCWGPIHLAG